MNDRPSHLRTLRAVIVVGAAMTAVGLLLMLSLAARDNGSAVRSAEREQLNPGAPVPTQAAGVTEAENAVTEVGDTEAGAKSDPVPVPERVTDQVDAPADELATPESTAATAPQYGTDRYVMRLVIDNDMGTGSTEFSAVALNEELGRLLIADDEGRLFEFDLTESGEPVVPARRALRVDVGAGDIEGIAWLTGVTYVIAHENDGRLTVVDINDELTSITNDELLRTLDTGVREEDGNGLEGVTYVGAHSTNTEFAVVDERPPTMYFIDKQNEMSEPIRLGFGVRDVSDLWAATDGSYWLLSDENKVVINMRIDDEGNAREVGSLNLRTNSGAFAQPEGIVGSRDGRRLYVVGEAPGPNSFSLAFFEVE